MSGAGWECHPRRDGEILTNGQESSVEHWGSIHAEFFVRVRICFGLIVFTRIEIY